MVLDRTRVSAPRAALLALVLVSLAVDGTFARFSACTTEITLLASPAVRGVIGELGREYERQTGERIVARFEVFDVLNRRIEKGEPFDIAVLSPEMIDAFIARGVIAPETRVDLGRHGVGLGVREGLPLPDISTPAALTRTLRAAESVAYFKDGTAGAHFLSVVARLGLSADLAGVLREYDAAGVDEAVRSRRTQYVAAGMGTLLAIPGIGGANPLPEPFQRYTTYTIGISSKATQPKGARAFLRALEGPAARAVVARHGLEPLHR